MQNFIFCRVGKIFRNIIISIHFNVSGFERSEEHTSELQSRPHLVCRLLLEKQKRVVAVRRDALRSGSRHTVRSSATRHLSTCPSQCPRTASSRLPSRSPETLGGSADCALSR